MWVCCFKPEDVANVLPHSGHAWLLAPTWLVRMCRCKLLGSVKTLSQFSHGKRRNSPWIILCLSKFGRHAKFFGQCSQGYCPRLWLCASIICSSKVKMSMNNLSHLIHLTPSSSSSSDTSLSPVFDMGLSEFRSISTSPLWLLPAVLLAVLPSSRMGSLGPNKSSSPTSIFLNVS